MKRKIPFSSFVSMVQWWDYYHIDIKELIGIQEMAGPTGQIFHLKPPSANN
jgi:hypothetical protein